MQFIAEVVTNRDLTPQLIGHHCCSQDSVYRQIEQSSPPFPRTCDCRASSSRSMSGGVHCIARLSTKLQPQDSGSGSHTRHFCPGVFSTTRQHSGQKNVFSSAFNYSAHALGPHEKKRRISKRCKTYLTHPFCPQLETSSSPYASSSEIKTYRR